MADKIATKRMHAFDRMLVYAKDINEEQEYNTDRRWRHNRVLHLGGIGEGLQVKGDTGGSSITVEPGLAIDNMGREIVLADQSTVQLSGDGKFGVYVIYRETFADKREEGGVTGYARIEETPVVKVLPLDNPLAGTDATAVLLAKVNVQDGKLTAAPTIDTDVPRAGTRLPDDAEFSSVKLKRADVSPANWPELSSTAARTVGLVGRLRLRGAAPIEPDDPNFILYAQDSIATATGLQVRVSNISTEAGKPAFAAFSATTAKGGVVTQFVADGLGTTGPLKAPGGYYGTFSAHPVGLVTGNTERVRIGTDGKVGIGTTNPTEQLDVNGRVQAGKVMMGPWPASPNNYVFWGTNALDQQKPENYALLQGVVGGDLGVTLLNSPKRIQFRIANSTKMFLSEDGKVGIGTETPTSDLDVKGNVTAGSVTAGVVIAASPVAQGIFPLFAGRVGQNTVFAVLLNGDVKVRDSILTSDKNAKENFSSLNTLRILENLAGVPIQVWNYKGDPASVRHIGPTAQDFQAAFGLNGDDHLHISSVDAQGVALAAIQGLNEKLKAENAQLHAKLANFEARLIALESKCSSAS